MKNSNSNTSASGIGIGSIIAILISVALNKSFWWAIIHMIFGWFYIIYALITDGPNIIPAIKSLFGI